MQVGTDHQHYFSFIPIKLIIFAGKGIGVRIAELITCREKLSKRETRLVNMLQFICNQVWKYLFNKAADNLERSMENEDEYMIHEHFPITNSFVSLPAEYSGQLNCASFIAGIIEGVLDSSRFPARVTAHHVNVNNGDNDNNGPTSYTVFLIKFSSEVMSREKKLGFTAGA